MKCYNRAMATYHAVVKQGGPWWIGWIEEIAGVNCQAGTRVELLEELRSALEEAIELNRSDARAAAGKSFEEATVTLRSGATCSPEASTGG